MEERTVTIDCGMRLFNLFAFDIDPLGEDADFVSGVRYEASQHSAKILDPGGRQRDQATLSKHRYLGVLSEKLITNHLRSIFGHEVNVSNRAFERYDAHVDIEIQVGDKEISFEVRSSFPYSPLKDVVCRLFDFIGPYTTSFKVGESPKDFYLRGLLRYSATHRTPYNLVYRLTPVEAYRQGLVKRIEVSGVEQEDDVNLAFVKVNNINSKKNAITARLSVHKLMRDGTVKEQSISVKPGDNLASKTKRSEYTNYIVEEINLIGEFVRFTNGVEINKGETIGDDKEAIFETQIRKTIEEHFRKQERLEPLNIKVLSLFFIDRVDNYTYKDGVIRRLFTKSYDQMKMEHHSWRDKDVESVQAAYFAHKRTQKGEIIYQDSATGKAKDDIVAYDLIMKDKERLLSFNEPVSFIFSHSALRFF